MDDDAKAFLGGLSIGLVIAAIAVMSIIQFKEPAEAKFERCREDILKIGMWQEECLADYIAMAKAIEAYVKSKETARTPRQPRKKQAVPERKYNVE